MKMWKMLIWEVIRSHILKNRQYEKAQKDKQRYTKHWKLKIEQHEGFQKGKHFLLHLCGFYIIALL